MSKFTVAAATMQTLSLVAAEEASRLGERTGDVDHLLLAVTVNEQVAGQALRALGVTLDRAREAVAEQHAAQLASLGVRAEAPTPDRITFHERGEFTWNERTMQLLRRSGQNGRRGDAAAVLRELVSEGSGLIEAVLTRLGTSGAEVLRLLDDAERYPARPQQAFDARTLSGTGESYVPAPPTDVWRLLSSPERMPEWEPGAARAADLPGEFAIGATWTMHAADIRPDGTPLRTSPKRRVSRVELVDLQPNRMLEWVTSWPEWPGSNTRRVRIELEPAAGGTRLLISQAWDRAADRRRLPVVGWLMSPLHRFAIWLQVSQLGASIGRVFR